MGPRTLGSLLASSLDGKSGQAGIEFLGMLGIPIRESRHPCVPALEISMLICTEIVPVPLFLWLLSVSHPILFLGS